VISKYFPVVLRIQASSGDHTDTYPIGKEGNSPGDKIAREYKSNNYIQVILKL
jgi:hypothetical protein